jgi:hypothetical protein
LEALSWKDARKQRFARESLALEAMLQHKILKTLSNIDAQG